MYIEPIKVVQISSVGLHIELVEKIKKVADFIDQHENNECIIRVHELLSIIEFFETDYPRFNQAKELYNSAYKFDYLMLIN
jgi:hypothetical protein